MTAQMKLKEFWIECEDTATPVTEDHQASAAQHGSRLRIAVLSTCFTRYIFSLVKMRAQYSEYFFSLHRWVYSM